MRTNPIRRLIAVGAALAAVSGAVAAGAGPASAAGPYLECSQTVAVTIASASTNLTYNGVPYTMRVDLQKEMDRRINSYYCGRMRSVATLTVPPASQAAKVRARVVNQAGSSSESGWVNAPAGKATSAYSPWRAATCAVAYNVADLPPVNGTEDRVVRTYQGCHS